MTHRTRIAAITISMAGAVVFGAGAVLATPAGADPAVPYTDFSASGYVGLCDASGHNVTGGSIESDPFIALATGSVPPPADYRGDGKEATLYAFVPRKGVPPSEWSSEPLTAPGLYSDWHFPTAKGTSYDPPLKAVLTDLPPQWDGWYELRLYYSADSRPIPGGGYAATDIRITGDTWSVARGGSVDCTGGKVVSKEELIPGLLASSTFVPTYINGRPNPKASWPGGVVPTYTVPDYNDDPLAPATATPSPGTSGTAPGSGTSAASGGPSTATLASSGAPSAAVDTAVSPSASTKPRQGGGLSSGALVAIVLGVLAIAGGALGWSRSRAPRSKG